MKSELVAKDRPVFKLLTLTNKLGWMMLAKYICNQVGDRYNREGGVMSQISISFLDFSVELLWCPLHLVRSCYHGKHNMLLVIGFKIHNLKFENIFITQQIKICNKCYQLMITMQKCMRHIAYLYVTSGLANFMGESAARGGSVDILTMFYWLDWTLVFLKSGRK